MGSVSGNIFSLPALLGEGTVVFVVKAQQLHSRYLRNPPLGAQYHGYFRDRRTGGAKALGPGGLKPCERGRERQAEHSQAVGPTGQRRGARI